MYFISLPISGIVFVLFANTSSLRAKENSFVFNLFMFHNMMHNIYAVNICS
jgi:hypothetical protein